MNLIDRSQPPILFKLKTYNINEDLIVWISDFLCNRKQCVIYINDLPELCAAEDPNSEIYLYADDSKIYKFNHI